MAPFLIGHWTDAVARTGCTVFLFSRLVPAVVDVRGGSPATRETDLLTGDALVGQVNAILLTGGSAFGLGAADGVMRFLLERGQGWPTAVMPVPIVPAAALFDLGVGSATWPNADSGYQACRDAVGVAWVKLGQVGVGAGATIRKLWPETHPRTSGFGYGVETTDSLTSVHAFVAVNAVGDIAGDDGADPRRVLLENSPSAVVQRESTTLGVVVVEGACSHRALRRIAIAAHDAYARALVPAHTLYDGDLVFACATDNAAELDPRTELRLSLAAEMAMESAIRNAVPKSA